MKDEYTVINKEEWEEESGERYYKKNSGAAKNAKRAGRTP